MPLFPSLIFVRLNDTTPVSFTLTSEVFAGEGLIWGFCLWVVFGMMMVFCLSLAEGIYYEGFE